MSVVALIPARGGSKRLPRKNVLPINGIPMLCYAIETAINSCLFDQVFVSTEDDEIASVAVQGGGAVIQRPPELARDSSTVVEVCLHALKLMPQVDLMCCIYPTSFLLKAQSLVDSIKLLDASPTANFVMGVSEYQFSPLQALKSDDHGFLFCMWPAWIDVKSQFYPRLVVSNGTFYWARRNQFIAEKTFYGKRLKGYVVDPNQVSDINTEEDLERALKILAIES